MFILDIYFQWRVISAVNDRAIYLLCIFSQSGWLILLVEGRQEICLFIHGDIKSGGGSSSQLSFVQAGNSCQATQHIVILIKYFHVAEGKQHARQQSMKRLMGYDSLNISRALVRF